MTIINQLIALQLDVRKILFNGKFIFLSCHMSNKLKLKVSRHASFTEPLTPLHVWRCQTIIKVCIYMPLKNIKFFWDTLYYIIVTIMGLKENQNNGNNRDLLSYFIFFGVNNITKLKIMFD